MLSSRGIDSVANMEWWKSVLNIATYSYSCPGICSGTAIEALIPPDAAGAARN